MADSLARAVFAGGCFWCVEAVFEELEGVERVVSGYAGGDAATADYRLVASGKTEHAEAVEIHYDAARVSYEKLLSVHFATHDPTTRNRQGADVGPQYRSAVFYRTDAEREAAAAMIARLNDSEAFAGRPIVTTLESLQNFYEAEPYHQDYVCNNPQNPYVAAVALPKVAKVRELFKDDLRKGEAMTRSDAPQVSVYVYNKSGELVGPVAREKLVLSDAEWQARLREEQYRILRKAGTERAFCGTLLDNKQEGVYACAGCALPLFSSDAKFKSGSGWPSFYQPIGAQHNVVERADNSHGMVRTEIVCARCDGHLGHVFHDGPPPTGLRYCLNSESLRFVEQASIGSDLGE